MFDTGFHSQIHVIVVNVLVSVVERVDILEIVIDDFPQITQSGIQKIAQFAIKFQFRKAVCLDEKIYRNFEVLLNIVGYLNGQ